MIPNKQHEYQKIYETAQLILNSKHLVVFTGAGISTESGLNDFRGLNGVWTRLDKGLPPLKGLPIDKVEPNASHCALVDLQNFGLLKFLISQNGDNLHLKSGIQPEMIAELHGNHTKMKCIACDSRFTKAEINWATHKFGRGFRTYPPVPGQPVCLNCSGRIISTIVNFEDPMPQTELDLAYEHSHLADVFIVVGSTLLVEPAASMPRVALANDSKLIIINVGETPFDTGAHIRFDAKAGGVLQKIVAKVKQLTKDKQANHMHSPSVSLSI